MLSFRHLHRRLHRLYPTSRARDLSTVYCYPRKGTTNEKLLRTTEAMATTPPTSDNLHVKWLAAGVDPMDIATMTGHASAKQQPEGMYPLKAGTEGVALVTAVGPEATGVVPGDFVIPIRSGVGTWREDGVVSRTQVHPVPRLRVELLATLSVSPFTAWRLLEDFSQLKAGDVVLQDAGGGPVGTAVVQIAHARGIRTVSIVRESEKDYAPTVERLKLMGGDVVIGDEYINTEGFRAVMADLPAPKLALHGGDEASCGILADLASDACAAVVSYCPGVANGAALKAKGLKSEIFSLSDWLDKCSKEDIEGMVTGLTGMIEEEKFTAWLQRVNFDDLPSAINTGGSTVRKLVAMMPSSSPTS